MVPYRSVYSWASSTQCPQSIKYTYRPTRFLLPERKWLFRTGGSEKINVVACLRLYVGLDLFCSTFSTKSSASMDRTTALACFSPITFLIEPAVISALCSSPLPVIFLFASSFTFILICSPSLERHCEAKCLARHRPGFVRLLGAQGAEAVIPSISFCNHFPWSTHLLQSDSLLRSAALTSDACLPDSMLIRGLSVCECCKVDRGGIFCCSDLPWSGSLLCGDGLLRSGTSLCAASFVW